MSELCHAMSIGNPKALVVTADERWRDDCVQVLRAEGCEVTTMLDSVQALDLFHRSFFEVVVADDSRRASMGPVEFVLNVQDLAPNRPVVLLAGENLDRFADVWRQRGVTFAGSKERLLAFVRGHVRHLLAGRVRE